MRSPQLAASSMTGPSASGGGLAGCFAAGGDATNTALLRARWPLRVVLISALGFHFIRILPGIKDVSNYNEGFDNQINDFIKFVN